MPPHPLHPPQPPSPPHPPPSPSPPPRPPPVVPLMLAYAIEPSVRVYCNIATVICAALLAGCILALLSVRAFLMRRVHRRQAAAAARDGVMAPAILISGMA